SRTSTYTLSLHDALPIYGCNYPDKNLAGVGVAFKLVHALFRARDRESVVPGFLKMVAIGTVADVAKLVGENRAIVALGLSDLPRSEEHTSELQSRFDLVC